MNIKHFIEMMMIVMKPRIPPRENVVGRHNLIWDSNKAPRMTYFAYWWGQKKQREKVARN